MSAGRGYGERYRRAPWFLYVVAGFVIILAVGPLMTLLAYSFFRIESYRLVTGFSLVNYQEIVTSWLYLSLTGRSLLYALATCAITLVIGYPTAQFIAWRGGKWKNILLMGLLIPLYTGDLIRVYAWRIILGIKGLLNTLLLELGVIDAPISALLFSPFSVMLSIVYIYLPFMILPIWANLESFDRSLVEASMDLGARRTRTFSKIVFPLTMPGVFAGMMLVFIPVTGDYLSQNLLGGTSGVTIMNVITAQFGASYNWPLGSALAWFLLLVVAAIISAAVYLMTRQSWVHQSIRGSA